MRRLLVSRCLYLLVFFFRFDYYDRVVWGKHVSFFFFLFSPAFGWVGGCGSGSDFFMIIHAQQAVVYTDRFNVCHVGVGDDCRR